MSASIRWRDVTPKPASLDCDTPNAFLEAMRKAFGDQSRWLLSSEHTAVLDGMAATWTGKFQTNPYEQLANLIRNDGTPRVLEVWAEY